MSRKDVAVVEAKRKGCAPLGGRGGAARSPEAVAHAASNQSKCKVYRPAPYPYEIRRRAVQLYTEEGISAPLVAKELGISDAAIYIWTARYRKYGEEGLKNPSTRGGGLKLPVAVKDKIIALKKENPEHGSKRISQILRRLFFLKASPETVRQQLKKAAPSLPKVKAKKKPKPPERRFEASKPNQMWQTDITYFQMHGKTAYIIGFIDDHSRYITGLGVYRSQTSENVVETYRLATGEFGVPKEMLTDNGRQYANWRGVTKFQKEMKKDHIHHIRSSPHHPMTLGKIERFWQSLKDEFLSRARFETFEEARERIAYWVKYYNHKRPHQGLDGMTPGDRFFSIQDEMKAAIERGMAANVEEMALRGKPDEPFYMVGRVGNKSVVIETDKKRVSVMLDGQELNAGQAMIYERKERTNHEAGTGGNDNTGNTETQNQDIRVEGKGAGGAVALVRQEEHVSADEGVGCAVGADQQLGEAGTLGNVVGSGSDMEAARGRTAEPAVTAGEADRTDDEASHDGGISGDKLRSEEHDKDRGTGEIRGGGEVPRSAGSMDGKEEGVGPLPGDGCKSVVVFPVAGPGSFGHAGGTGTARDEGRNGGACVADADQASAGSQSQSTGSGNTGAERQLAQSSSENQDSEGSLIVSRGLLNEEVREVDGTGRSESTETDAGDPGSSGRTDQRDAIGAGTRGEPEDVLRVAGTSQGCGLLIPEGSNGRATSGSSGLGEGPAAGGTGTDEAGQARVGEPASNPGSDPADHRGNPRRFVAA
jgi:transposase InsO family protein